VTGTNGGLCPDGGLGPGGGLAAGLWTAIVNSLADAKVASAARAARSTGLAGTGVNVAVTVCCTCAVNSYVPTVVGCPVMAPSAVSVRPGGSFPAATVQVSCRLFSALVAWSVAA
jgi:hypothetical protein